MDRVAFITTEQGDDLVLAFAVQCPDEPTDIESLILMRTPKYEFILEEHERGVKVSFERDDEDEDELLERFGYIQNDAVVRIKTSTQEYQLDVAKVHPTELKMMRKVLKKMNYDQSFQMSGF